jgi:hypothetical protein
MSFKRLQKTVGNFFFGNEFGEKLCAGVRDGKTLVRIVKIVKSLMF